MTRLATAFIASLLLSGTAFSKGIRIAGIYPNHTVGHLNCTCGLEAACITNAVIQRARENGMNISFTQVNKDWDVFKTHHAAKRIVKQKFDAAIGTLVSADALVAADVLDQAGIAFVVPTATHPKVTAGRKNVTRIPFNDYRQSALLARLALTDLSAKKIAVIRNASNPYSDFLGKQFAKEIKQRDSSVIVSDFPIFQGFAKFDRLLDKVLSKKPDLLFVPLPQSQMASIYVELVARGAALTLLSSDTIEGKPKFLQLLTPTSDDIKFIYPKHWNGQIDGPESNAYEKLHKKYCSQYEPSMTTMAAYDAAQLVVKALSKKPKARGSELIRTIHGLSYHGMTGEMRYGKDGDPIKPIELFRLEGNDVRYWKRYE